MAQAFEELSVLLVQDTYGPVHERIISTIAASGRLTRHQLRVQLRIPRRELRQALFTLLQQHILLCDRSRETVAFYQINWRSVHALARADRIGQIVKERYGRGAASIVTELQRLGHASVGLLAQELGVAPRADREGENETQQQQVDESRPTNGATPDHTRRPLSGAGIDTVAKLHATLRTLLRFGVLIKISQRTYMPAADLQAEAEQIVIDEQFPDGKVTGPKKQVDFRNAVNTLKRKWQEEDEYSELRDLKSNGTVQRPTKRAKVKVTKANGTAHNQAIDVDDSLPALPNDMCLRINFAQCAVSFRTQLLREFSSKFLGDTTASVYGALLRVLEGKTRTREQNVPDEPGDDEEEDDDETRPGATTSEIVELLDPRIDLTDSINGAAELYKRTDIDKRDKGKTKLGYINQDHEDLGIKTEIASDSEDDHPVNGYRSLKDRNRRMNLVEEHLNLLKEHPKAFCSRLGSGGISHGDWHVDFSALAQILAEDHIDRTVTDRFGKMYTRVVRLLREKGKLDERQIIAMCMMQTKDLRTILTQLQFAGIIEVQEVPRDATRQPGRTIYLWYYETKRYQHTLLHDTYQGMARVLQRLKVERKRHKNAIEKAEKSDANLTSLNANERDAIMLWREVEERLLVQLHRMDDDVAMLRDVSGKDTSLVS